MRASSCPTTLVLNLEKSCKYFSLSSSTNLPTGIPLHLDTIAAISSISTLSLRNDSHFFWFSASSFSEISISFSSAGISLYLILATA